MLSVPATPPSWSPPEARKAADRCCEPWKHTGMHEGCSCVGQLMYQAICAPCEWNGIADSENVAVEMWHDDALPGWRDLPIVAARLRLMDSDKLTKSAQKWIAEHHPKSMQVPGAPITTERRPSGTRCGPGHSPWGG